MSKQGFTVWITGLPNSGKTTISMLLIGELARRGFALELLDGNEIRNGLSPRLGFEKADREEHNIRVGFLAKLLNKHGVVAVAAMIAPYRELRARIRSMIGRYVEVYLECPQEELIARDTKDLYQRALKGEIKNFTGISAPYEIPSNPELTLHTGRMSVEQCCQAILTKLEEMGYIDSQPEYSEEECQEVENRLKDLGYM